MQECPEFSDQSCPVESYDANEEREQYISRMKKEGYEVVYPKDNELFIDIDSEDDLQLFRDQYEIFHRDYKVTSMQMRESRNGLPGRHVIVTLPFFVTDIERIAYQAALGSDPVRELLSLRRLKDEDDHPTLFVEKIPW